MTVRRVRSEESVHDDEQVAVQRIREPGERLYVLGKVEEVRAVHCIADRPDLHFAIQDREKLGVVGEFFGALVGEPVVAETFTLVDSDLGRLDRPLEAVDHDHSTRRSRVVLDCHIAMRVMELTLALRCGEEVTLGIEPPHRILDCVV